MEFLILVHCAALRKETSQSEEKVTTSGYCTKIKVNNCLCTYIHLYTVVEATWSRICGTVNVFVKKHWCSSGVDKTKIKRLSSLPNDYFCLFHLLGQNILIVFKFFFPAFNIFWMCSNIFDHAQICKFIRCNLTLDHDQNKFDCVKIFWSQ